jgi:hypothetical protein
VGLPGPLLPGNRRQAPTDRVNRLQYGLRSRRIFGKVLASETLKDAQEGDPEHRRAVQALATLRASVRAGDDGVSVSSRPTPQDLRRC